MNIVLRWAAAGQLPQTLVWQGRAFAVSSPNLFLVHHKGRASQFIVAASKIVSGSFTSVVVGVEQSSDCALCLRDQHLRPFWAPFWKGNVGSLASPDGAEGCGYEYNLTYKKKNTSPTTRRVLLVTFAYLLDRRLWSGNKRAGTVFSDVRCQTAVSKKAAASA
eukprot:5005702-Pyramimonas_sp.AAC.1